MPQLLVSCFTCFSLCSTVHFVKLCCLCKSLMVLHGFKASMSQHRISLTSLSLQNIIAHIDMAFVHTHKERLSELTSVEDGVWIQNQRMSVTQMDRSCIPFLTAGSSGGTNSFPLLCHKTISWESFLQKLSDL